MPKAPRTSSTSGTATGNAWTLFRSAELKKFKAKTGGMIGQGDFSKMISPIWRAMSPQEQKPWYDLAKEKKEEALRLAQSNSGYASAEVAPSRTATVPRRSTGRPRKSRSQAVAQTQAPLAAPFIDSRATSVSSDLGVNLFQGSTEGSTSTAPVPTPRVWRSVQVREVFPTIPPDGGYQWQFPLVADYVSNEPQNVAASLQQQVNSKGDDWFIDPSLRTQYY